MKNSKFLQKKLLNLTKVTKDYEKNGFVIIRNFINKKFIKDIKEELADKKTNNKLFYYENIQNVKKLRRIEKISDFSKKSKKLIRSTEILKLIKNLENSNHDLLKDKLNYKYPGGQGYLPHIDGHFLWKDKNNKLQNGWKKYSDNFINLVLPLEQTNKKNGCLYVAKKKDTLKLGKNFKKISQKMDPTTPNIQKKDFKKFKFYPIELDEGDILLFNWKCAHYSKKNFSKNSRMIFYATYYKKRNLLKKNAIRQKYYKDKFHSKSGRKNKSLLFN